MSSLAHSQQHPAEVALSGVTRRFDDSFSLQDVSFSAADGESIVLIGPSASGKTVTLKTIIGLFQPDAGSILIRGQETVGLNGAERARVARVGMLFQRSALFDSMTVWENITFRLGQTAKLQKSEAIDLAGEKLAAVGLSPDTALLYPVELSGGMQKRVGIARALADNPDILLLDEPTAGLDPIMTNVINDLILENVHSLGATVISVTSNLDGARHIADHIVMMNEGSVVWTGHPDDLDQSGNAYVDQFVHKTADGPIGAGLA
jgi:phospholipid/cholesterol/gamma-HCH transport system ATP-binding protein